MILLFLKRILSKLGVDKAVGYTVLTRIVQAGGGIISLTLIAAFLSREEQGYYYTFGSIVAIQVFFELGLNNIITQYVAYEVVHLQWNGQSDLSGSQEHLSRLSSLLHFCLKVFGVLAIVLFLVLSISGFIFFTRYSQASHIVNWQLPWVCIAFSTSLMLIINPILAFFEGLGKVKEVAKIRLVQQSANILCVAFVLFIQGGLFALGVASFLSFLVLAGSIVFTHRKTVLLFIYESKGPYKVNYWSEIFPYQWKIALSWVSGYFLFQLFNPVLFATEGTVVAGKMGMTLVVLNGISGLTLSWINTKIPMMSSLVSQGKNSELNEIFRKTLIRIVILNFLALISFMLLMVILNTLNVPVVNRFLPLFPLSLLCLTILAIQFIYCWATYLRCHKQEPFLVNSLITGLICAISIILFGKYFGLIGIVSSYTAIILFINLPWAYYIFINKKQQYELNSSLIVNNQ